MSAPPRAGFVAVVNLAWPPGGTAPHACLRPDVADPAAPVLLDGVSYPTLDATWRAIFGPQRRSRGYVLYRDRTYRRGGEGYRQLVERGMREWLRGSSARLAALMATGEAKLTYTPVATGGRPAPDRLIVDSGLWCPLLMALRSEAAAGALASDPGLPPDDGAPTVPPSDPTSDSPPDASTPDGQFGLF